MDNNQMDHLPELGEVNKEDKSFIIPSGMITGDDVKKTESFSHPRNDSVVVPHSLQLDDDDIEHEDDSDEENDATPVDGKPFVTYQCSRCHASFSTGSKSGNAHCVYCNSLGLQKIADEVIGGSVIPFVETIKDAASLYKKKIRFNPFIPFSFRGKKNLKKIRKVYVTGTYYDMVARGDITFYGADKIQKIKGAPMQTFESLYHTEFEYPNILVSNCSQIGDELLSAINNYHLSTMKDFEESYLNDSYVINGDKRDDVILESVQNRVIKYAVNTVRGTVPHEMKKTGDIQIVPEIRTQKTVLIPIYLLTMDYKGQNHYFIMNGQTGEAIVDLPMSAGSIILFSILTFGIVFLIVFLLAHLF
ncbi:MAG: hypothetical protein J6X28_02145 [Bacilli bacterium]|nr:hypothetical protein [Bacilli bacterium]